MHSNIANTIPVKFRLAGASCRRARLDIPLTMITVTQKLMTSFPELKSGQFCIKYQDEEGDQIEVVSDADLHEAVAVFDAVSRVLSFTVVLLDPMPTQSRHGHPERLSRHRNHAFRRWHALSNMLGLRPQDMEPQMQDMFRFGMLKYFMGSKNHMWTEHKETVEHKNLQCTFVSDITVPDGSTMKPKQRFDKKWVVKTGDNPWPEGCTLVHVGGHPMGTKRRKFRPAPLCAVAANSKIELTVTLKAPKPTRKFVSKWRMCSPDGLRFGDCMWVTINVEKGIDISPVKATEVVDLTCKFVSDATIPDGSIMQPRQCFDKKWVVKTGKNAWPAGCVLLHVGGNPMGTKRLQFRPTPLGEVPANSKVELVVTLQAPKPCRNFVSKWRMCTRDGRQFGEYLLTFINVQQKVGATDTDTGLECKFVSDATIPDGSSMQPQQHFNKKWVIKTGKNAWPAGCTLVHVGGHAMGAKRPKFRPAPLGAVPANSQVELTVTLKAPKPTRDFVSNWRMRTPDGHLFGDYVWTLISVDPEKVRSESKAKAAEATQTAVPAAPKPVSVARPATTSVPPAVAATTTTAVAVATSAVSPPRCPKVQQLLAIFPLPAEMLASVLTCTGGDVHAAAIHLSNIAR